MTEEKKDDLNGIESLRFLSLVSMLVTSAYVCLGKLARPQDGKVERDLDEAQGLIDLLITLRNKTAGNLSQKEADYLKNVISDLQLNFVREKEKPSPAPEKETPAAGPREGNAAAPEAPKGDPTEGTGSPPAAKRAG